MREIKFRYVWERPKSGAGPYRPDDDKVKIVHLSLADIENHKSTRPLCYPDYLYSLLVARNEYIGLKDKNGKESYHKDITDDNGRRFTIEWLDDRAQFALIPVGASRALALPMECLKNMEVIGNIYENEELLGGK